jgi:Zn-dependent protease with chaperone function/tellurite resistance protein
MNFFEAQDRSRRHTRRLILVMTLAVVAVVVSVTAVVAATVWLASSPLGATGFSSWLGTNRQLLFWIALGSTAFIGFASLYRIMSLRQGGGKVARDLGGTRIDPGDNDPLRRRLRNVVEEMALASGVPTPEVYILDHEPGINAFAAGFSTEDAAIAVTRGTLETLNRDELQGVIAHEFSHVFNGDMRLNIQLMGPMFGILAIGLLGRLLLRGTRFSGRSRGKAGGTAAILALGAGLAVTGFVGLLLARLIKAGVSRQREYLADASAVQFTRQTAGIAGALKKIAGYKQHSTIHDNDAEEVSHMLFASGFSSMSSLLATHPPLLNRIQALEPSFDEAQFNQLHTEPTRLDTAAELQSRIAGFTGHAGQPEPGAPAEAAFSNQPVTIATAALTKTIGNPDEQHYRAAQIFIATLPDDIRAALDSGYHVMLLLPALLLHHDASARAHQLRLLEQQLGAQRCRLIGQLYAALQTMHSEARLPILNLALPLLKEQPAGRLEYLGDLLEQLAMQDNQIDLFEYALLRIYQNYVQHSAQPAARRRWQTLADARMQNAAAELLRVFAEQAAADSTDTTILVQRAFATLGTQTNIPATSRRDSGDWVKQADAALLQLQHCTPRARHKLIQALMAIALHDGHISQPESELLRAFCTLLDCPLPPILGTP